VNDEALAHWGLLHQTIKCPTTELRVYSTFYTGNINHILITNLLQLWCLLAFNTTILYLRVTSFFNFICDNIKGNCGSLTIKVMKQEQQQFNHFYCPINPLNYTNLEVKIYVV
jgi:hypothetical protein